MTNLYELYHRPAPQGAGWLGGKIISLHMRGGELQSPDPQSDDSGPALGLGQSRPATSRRTVSRLITSHFTSA